MHDDKLEILLTDHPFRTLQGEGRYAGQGAVFVRTTGCLVQCAWCDSRFSWMRNDSTISYDTDRLAHLLSVFACRGTDYAVITGGEPFLHDASIASLLHELAMCNSQNKDKAVMYRIGFETSGVAPMTETANYIANNPYAFAYHITFSPKLTSALCPPDAKGKTPIQLFLSNYESAFAHQRVKDAVLADFKFVITKQFFRDDIEEVKQLVALYPQIVERKRVWLMLEHTMFESEDLHHYRKLWETCITLGYNFTPRLHTISVGAKRNA